MAPKGISRLWLPVLVALAGVLAAVWSWEALRTERRSREQAMLATVAGDSRQAIRAAAERQIEAMRDLATSWARFGPRSLEAWRFEAGRHLEIFPGLVSLAWIGGDGQVVRIAGSEAPRALADIEERGWLEALAARPEAGGRVLMAGPRTTADDVAYELVVPGVHESRREGVLVAAVSVPRMLSAILRDSAPGYAVSVRWGDQEIFRRDDPDEAHAWQSRGFIELSPGVDWEASYAPTSALVRDSLSPWPAYLLAAGLVISVLLGILVHQLRSAEGTLRGLDDLNQELERRVEERTRELEAAVTELEAFNYSVSHDLRSPLGSILTFAVVLEEDLGERLGAEAREMLERIRRSAQTSMELLDGLVELSRAGRAELQQAPVDLAELAREVWAEIATGQEGDVSFEVAPLPKGWGDPLLLRQVLANLLRNALKFSASREKPCIQVGAERLEGEDCYYVRDNGVGFDGRFASKLFRPFERLHPQGEFEGAGVGLAVVRRLVARHGGRVWAESEPGAGATFFFTLPRSPRDPS